MIKKHNLVPMIKLKKLIKTSELDSNYFVNNNMDTLRSKRSTTQHSDYNTPSLKAPIRNTKFSVYTQK